MRLGIMLILMRSKRLEGLLAVPVHKAIYLLNDIAVPEHLGHAAQ